MFKTAGETHHISVLKVYAEAKRSSREGLRRNERVRKSRFMTGLHRSLVGQRGEVLNEEVEVHGVAERCV